MRKRLEDYDPQASYTAEEYEEWLAVGREACQRFSHKLGRVRTAEDFPNIFASMTEEEIFQCAVAAGIMTEDGHFMVSCV